MFPVLVSSGSAVSETDNPLLKLSAIASRFLVSEAEDLSDLGDMVWRSWSCFVV